MENKIDFVMIWVDGNDVNWQKEKAKYTPNKTSDDSPTRYRDWETLKYWFRGIENYAPWVNKIHFVTYGHLPSFLNTNHPKLNIVNHKDYIPEKYLPTFSSHPIELNLHRIKDLSEQFVYFNDDIFILNKLKPTDFFKNGLPKELAALVPIMQKEKVGTANIRLNNTNLINLEYDKKTQIRKNFFKWYNLKSGKHFLGNILMSPYTLFPGFGEQHICTNFLKSSFETAWEKFYDALDETSSHKFRDTKLDVNQYLIQNLQLVTGKFLPRSIKFGKPFFSLDEKTIKKIVFSKYKIVCINDPDDITHEQFLVLKEKLIETLEKKFPKKSSFEL